MPLARAALLAALVLGGTYTGTAGDAAVRVRAWTAPDGAVHVLEITRSGSLDGEPWDRVELLVLGAESGRWIGRAGVEFPLRVNAAEGRLTFVPGYPDADWSGGLRAVTDGLELSFDGPGGRSTWTLRRTATVPAWPDAGRCLALSGLSARWCGATLRLPGADGMREIPLAT